MCARCDGFLERRQVNLAYEYQDLVRQILETIQQGTFRFIDGTCPLERVLTSPWPADDFVNFVECTTCGRRFELSTNAYKGGRARWEPIITASSNAVQ